MQMKKFGGSVLYEVILQKSPNKIKYRASNKKQFYPRMVENKPLDKDKNPISVVVESNSYFTETGKSVRGLVR